MFPLALFLQPCGRVQSGTSGEEPVALGRSQPAGPIEYPHSAAGALRVAIALDSYVQPAWVCRLIENLQRSAASVFVSVTGTPSTPHDRARGKTIRDLYLRIDGSRYRRPDGDALELRDIRTIVPAETGGTGSGEPADVAIDLTRLADTGWSPRLGTWSVEIGDGRSSSNGLGEFLAAAPATVATIVARRGDRADVVGRLRCGTDLISYRRGMNRLFWSVAELLCERIAACARGVDVFGWSDDITPDPRPERTSTISGIAAAYRRELRQKVRDRWMRQQWIVALGRRIDPSRPDHLGSIQQLVPPEDRIWADPFLVEREGRLFIFVEEMEYRQRRGRIAVIEADGLGRWATPETVLDRPYHLSYPCIFQWNGDDYMLPESGENRTIEIYRCVSFPERWEPAAVLFRDIHAVDSTIFEAFGRWWLYTSVSANGRTFEELLLFHADTPLGPWKPHRLNPLTIDTIGGRCAGLPFQHEGRLYRAAQIGTRRYGYAMQIREIVKLTPEEWIERETSRIFPTWEPGLAGTHTLNVAGDFCVVDGVRYRWGKRKR